MAQRIPVFEALILIPVALVIITRTMRTIVFSFAIPIEFWDEINFNHLDIGPNWCELFTATIKVMVSAVLSTSTCENNSR